MLKYANSIVNSEEGVEDVGVVTQTDLDDLQTRSYLNHMHFKTGECKMIDPETNNVRHTYKSLWEGLKIMYSL